MPMKRLPPDTRLDWRDPSMLVYREYTMGNGKVLYWVEPEFEQRYRAMKMSTEQPVPDWRDDPTYNMRKKRNV